MFSQKLFRWVNKVALFAIIFASLAPSISHALQANNGTGFAQEICSANGKKITIQVVTSKGQQLTTEFSASQEKPAKNITMHLEHCPFCGSSATVATLPSDSSAIIALLEASAQKIAQYAAPAVVLVPYISPPSQAPPSL